MKCKTCGHNNGDSDRYCRNCLVILTDIKENIQESGTQNKLSSKKCAGCGQENNMNSKYCIKCGNLFEDVVIK